MTSALPKPVGKECSRPRRIARHVSLKRGRRPRQQRKGVRAAQKRECDRLFSLSVRTKANGCARCGRFRGLGPETLDCAHVFGRSYQRTRWSPDNAFALCRACHDELGSASFAKPSKMEDFYVARRGRFRFDLLKVLARTKTRFFQGTLDMVRSRAVAAGVVDLIPPEEIPL